MSEIFYTACIAKVLLSLGGIGHLPILYGTVASVVAIPICICLSKILPAPMAWKIAIVTVLLVIAYVVSVRCIRQCIRGGRYDVKFIVIDEFLGMTIALLPTLLFGKISVIFLLISLVLFRFFDIVKPLGIAAIDKQNTPHAVILDDLLAGLYTVIVTGLLFTSALTIAP